MNTITLKPEITELYTLTEFITKEIGEKNFQINLIAEETFVNIVNYSKTEFIKVNVEFENNSVTLEFVDNGFEFNPLLKENPTAPNTIDEAEVGGLGIFLTKEIADELDYHYENGENHLKITKNV